MKDKQSKEMTTCPSVNNYFDDTMLYKSSIVLDPRKSAPVI